MRRYKLIKRKAIPRLALSNSTVVEVVLIVVLLMGGLQVIVLRGEI
jgi:uncharacterized protein YhhL (DUF1145 family)